MGVVSGGTGKHLTQKPAMQLTTTWWFDFTHSVLGGSSATYPGSWWSGIWPNWLLVELQHWRGPLLDPRKEGSSRTLEINWEPRPGGYIGKLTYRPGGLRWSISVFNSCNLLVQCMVNLYQAGMIFTKMTESRWSAVQCNNVSIQMTCTVFMLVYISKW
jgi:hypothetical protein